MKITDIETIFVDGYLFVKVHTDDDISGLGHKKGGTDENYRCKSDDFERIQTMELRPY
ncbi:MAG: hypothetical protein ACE5PV_04585 [Candidatus Poribacteria bacterium]